MGAYKYFIIKDIPISIEKNGHVNFNWNCPFLNLEYDGCQVSDEVANCPSVSNSTMKVPEKCPLRHGRIVVKLEGRD